jgi:hypothetical protein
VRRIPVIFRRPGNSPDDPVNFVRAICKGKDPLWDARVLWQVYGMAGLVRSIAKGWGWFKSLMKGPLTKSTAEPRPRLEVVSPAATGHGTRTHVEGQLV